MPLSGERARAGQTGHLSPCTGALLSGFGATLINHSVQRAAAPSQQSHRSHLSVQDLASSGPSKESAYF